MSYPQIAIVGRPNVGKSSLFNWLIGDRISIVDSVAGVTRDRITYRLEYEGQTLELVDTGGIGVVDRDDLSEHIERQIQIALESAAVALFVTDAREGVTSLDEVVAQRLRELSAPVICVVNKADTENEAKLAIDFYQFGWEIVTVSALQKRGRSALMDAIEKNLPAIAGQEQENDSSNPTRKKTSDEKEEREMRIAIVGRRNVGKSTFINTLTNEERVIASPIPGTTRDSIDVRFEMDAKTFIAIDTPGFRKRKSVKADLDFYSVTRAERSIRMADVVLMFFDCSQQIGKVDKQLVGYIERHNKPCIFVVNKWDLMAEQMPTERWADYLRETFATLWYVPIIFVTGLTGKNSKRLVNHARMLYHQSRSRTSTAKLNKLIMAALEYSPPPLYYHRKPKIYYATQTEVQPPEIVLFCNNPDMFAADYRRYLLGVLRDELDFGEVPIRLVFKKREGGDSENASDTQRKA
ncbi:MAG: ribosome biogenesis GTPase Der [Planctomycetaceae bacterium]|jgi:GTP-binding protein|nr:ribosome biogenesis GTPase Der [Planctomycetaceae bacterium]